MRRTKRLRQDDEISHEQGQLQIAREEARLSLLIELYSGSFNLNLDPSLLPALFSMVFNLSLFKGFTTSPSSHLLFSFEDLKLCHLAEMRERHQELQSKLKMSVSDAVRHLFRDESLRLLLIELHSLHQDLDDHLNGEQGLLEQFAAQKPARWLQGMVGRIIAALHFFRDLIQNIEAYLLSKNLGGSHFQALNQRLRSCNQILCVHAQNSYELIHANPFSEFCAFTLSRLEKEAIIYENLSYEDFEKLDHRQLPKKLYLHIVQLEGLLRCLSGGNKLKNKVKIQFIQILSNQFFDIIRLSQLQQNLSEIRVFYRKHCFDSRLAFTAKNLAQMAECQSLLLSVEKKLLEEKGHHCLVLSRALEAKILESKREMSHTWNNVLRAQMTLFNGELTELGKIYDFKKSFGSLNETLAILEELARVISIFELTVEAQNTYFKDTGFMISRQVLDCLIEVGDRAAKRLGHLKARIEQLYQEMSLHELTKLIPSLPGCADYYWQQNLIKALFTHADPFEKVLEKQFCEFNLFLAMRKFLLGKEEVQGSLEHGLFKISKLRQSIEFIDSLLLISRAFTRETPKLTEFRKFWETQKSELAELLEAHRLLQNLPKLKSGQVSESQIGLLQHNQNILNEASRTLEFLLEKFGALIQNLPELDMEQARDLHQQAQEADAQLSANFLRSTKISQEFKDANFFTHEHRSFLSDVYLRAEEKEFLETATQLMSLKSEIIQYQCLKNNAEDFEVASDKNPQLF